MGWGKGKNDDDNVIPFPVQKCPPHIWVETYDAEGEIIGRICTKCGTIEGRLK